MSHDYRCMKTALVLIPFIGLVTRVVQPDGQTKLQVMAIQESHVGPTADLLRDWKAEAKKDWSEPGHRRWTIVKEQLVSNLLAAVMPALLSPKAILVQHPRAQELAGGSISSLSPRPSIAGDMRVPSIQVRIYMFGSVLVWCFYVC